MPQALAAKDQWYVVHVLSGQENKVKDNIEKRVKTEEMTDVIYEVLVPTERVSEIKKVGTQVKQGEPLMMIHYNDEAKLEQALEYFKNAYRLAPKRPTQAPGGYPNQR